MRALALLFTCSAVWAQPAPPDADAALDWLASRARRQGLQVLQDSSHLVWGKDAARSRWEALVLLMPVKRDRSARVVRLFRSPRGAWASQQVLNYSLMGDDRVFLTAFTAGDLAEMWCPPLLPSQRGDIPSLPIEFHLRLSPDEFLSDEAMVFHPRLGLAEVVSTLRDDEKAPEPPGQVWGTHARGESVDLPLSAVKSRAKKLDRWAGRVWFRLDGQLYAICEGDWRVKEVQKAAD